MATVEGNQQQQQPQQEQPQQLVQVQLLSDFVTVCNQKKERKMARAARSQPVVVSATPLSATAAPATAAASVPAASVPAASAPATALPDAVMASPVTISSAKDSKAQQRPQPRIFRTPFSPYFSSASRPAPFSSHSRAYAPHQRSPQHTGNSAAMSAPCPAGSSCEPAVQPAQVIPTLTIRPAAWSKILNSSAEVVAAKNAAKAGRLLVAPAAPSPVISVALPSQPAYKTVDNNSTSPVATPSPPPAAATSTTPNSTPAPIVSKPACPAQKTDTLARQIASKTFSGRNLCGNKTISSGAKSEDAVTTASTAGLVEDNVAREAPSAQCDSEAVSSPTIASIAPSDIAPPPQTQQHQKITKTDAQTCTSTDAVIALRSGDSKFTSPVTPKTQLRNLPATLKQPPRSPSTSSSTTTIAEAQDIADPVAEKKPVPASVPATSPKAAGHSPSGSRKGKKAWTPLPPAPPHEQNEGYIRDYYARDPSFGRSNGGFAGSIDANNKTGQMFHGSTRGSMRSPSSVTGKSGKPGKAASSGHGSSAETSVNDSNLQSAEGSNENSPANGSDGSALDSQQSSASAREHRGDYSRHGNMRRHRGQAYVQNSHGRRVTPNYATHEAVPGGYYHTYYYVPPQGAYVQPNGFPQDMAGFAPATMAAYAQMSLSQASAQPQYYPMAHFYSSQPAQQHSPSPTTAMLTAQPLHAAIRRQVEFYFSFENLIHDPYLRKCMDENGWVSIQTIVQFPRMRPLAQENLELVVQSLECSKDLELDSAKINVRSRKDWETWVKLPVVPAPQTSTSDLTSGAALLAQQSNGACTGATSPSKDHEAATC